MNKKLCLQIISFLILIALVIFFWPLLQELPIRELVEQEENQLIVVLIVITLFVSKSILFFLPVKLIYISAGVALPLGFALIVNLVGVFLEISLTYFYGRFLGQDIVQKIINRYPQISEKLKKGAAKDIYLIFFLRLAPVAIEPVSLFMGSTNFNYFRYSLASILGFAPKLLLFTVIGDTFVNPITFWRIFFVLFLIICWLLTILIIRQKKQKQEA